MKISLGTKLLGVLVLLIPLAWESLIERERHITIDGFGFYAWFGFVACLMLVADRLADRARTQAQG